MNKIALFIAIIALVSLAVQPKSGQASHVPPGTFNYVLSNWVWEVEEDGFSYWRSPDCTVGSVDLRSLPQQGALGPLPQGYGFFAIESACPLPVGAIGLSDDLASAPPSATLNTLESLFRVRDGALDGVNTEEVVWRLLTSHADPSGANGPKPIMPGTSLNLELHLGGHSLVRSERYDRNVHTHVVEVLRLDYERIKTDSLSRDDETYLKVAGYWRDKYSFDVRTEEQKLDGIRSPETTILDDFNRANGSLDGTGPGTWTWNNYFTTLGIISEQVSETSGEGSLSEANTDLSSDDHYVQALNSSMGASSGRSIMLHARLDVSGYDAYFIRAQDTSVALFKAVGVTAAYFPTSTQIGSTATIGGVPRTLKLEVNGSTITVFRDGVAVIGPETDMVITGHLRTGIGIRRGSPRWDDFEAADLAAPSQRRIINIIGSMRTIWQKGQYARPR